LLLVLPHLCSTVEYRIIDDRMNDIYRTNDVLSAYQMAIFYISMTKLAMLTELMMKTVLTNGIVDSVFDCILLPDVEQSLRTSSPPPDSRRHLRQMKMQVFVRENTSQSQLLLSFWKDCESAELAPLCDTVVIIQYFE
jgi:hypothetical protein